MAWVVKLTDRTGVVRFNSGLTPSGVRAVCENIELAERFERQDQAKSMCFWIQRRDATCTLELVKLLESRKP